MIARLYNNHNILFYTSRTKKVSVRLPVWRRTIIDYCTDHFQESISDLVSLAIDSLFILDEIPNKGQVTQKAKDKMASMRLLEFKKQ